MVSGVSNGTIWGRVTNELRKTNPNVSQADIAAATNKVMSANGVTATESRSMSQTEIGKLNLAAIAPPAPAPAPAPAAAAPAATTTTTTGQANTVTPANFFQTLFQQALTPGTPATGAQPLANMTQQNFLTGLLTGAALNSSLGNSTQLGLQQQSFLNGLITPPVAPSALGTGSGITIDNIGALKAPTNFQSSVQLGGLLGGVVNNIGGRDVLAQRGIFV